jgi:DNA-binding transcriptional regulator YiaG
MNRRMATNTWTPARIKALRERYGEKQEEFARRFRITVHTLRFWEQGQGKVSGPATVILDQLEANAPELQTA